MLILLAPSWTLPPVRACFQTCCVRGNGRHQAANNCCVVALQVGSTVSGRPGFEDDAKTLRDLKFEIGDLLDVAVFV